MEEDERPLPQVCACNGSRPGTLKGRELCMQSPK